MRFDRQVLFAAVSLATLVSCQTIVQVVATSNRQVIDGFGCSLAFMGQAVQQLPTTPRNAILSTLFSTTSGAGFSILRTRISPFLSSSPGTFDFTSDSEEVGTRYVINQAKTYGVQRFLATAWSPPAYCKTNGNVNGGNIDNSVTSFSNYAAYLSKYVSTYTSTYNIAWYAISPQNEPELSASYESCVWQPSDFVTFLGTYLRPRFTQDKVSVLTLAAESTEWQEGTIGPTLQDSTARAAVQIVAAHPYRAGEPDSNGEIRTSGYDYFPLTAKWGKALWASEYSNITSTADSISELVRIAVLVHKQMTVPESTAFLFWWGATNKQDAPNIGESLILFNASGSYTIRKRLWALAQFARFIRPGWVRVDAAAEPVKGVHISAYKDGTSGQIAIVAINENSAYASVKFNLYGFQASTVAAYRTSSTELLKSVGNTAVSQGSFTVSLSAQSITTFVGAKNTSSSAFSGSPPFISEFNSLVGSSGASGHLTDTFYSGTIDPSYAGSDETAVFRQTNTAQYIQYPVTKSAFKSFVLSVQRNSYTDGLSFAAVSSTGGLTTLTAAKSAETTQPGDWHLYTYTITSVPTGALHIRIVFSATNAEWNPRLTRLVIT